jgi:hypothetical protein
MPRYMGLSSVFKRVLARVHVNDDNGSEHENLKKEGREGGREERKTEKERQKYSLTELFVLPNTFTALKVTF